MMDTPLSLETISQPPFCASSGIVTHNMQQAARISDRTAFFLLGELVEVGPTNQIFSTPRDKRTEDYISGRFG